MFSRSTWGHHALALTW